MRGQAFLPAIMHFCVCCGNLLQLEAAAAVGGNMRFYCQTCPYVYTLRTRVISEVPLEHKAVDDVLGGPEAWKNADQTDAVRSRAYEHRATPFGSPARVAVCRVHIHVSAAPSVQIGAHTISSASQGSERSRVAWTALTLACCTLCADRLQIRSADEPMTTFYKCTECGFRWRED